LDHEVSVTFPAAASAWISAGTAKSGGNWLAKVRLSVFMFGLLGAKVGGKGRGRAIMH
jgi:hypothetical protein